MSLYVNMDSILYINMVFGSTASRLILRPVEVCVCVCMCVCVCPFCARSFKRVKLTHSDWIQLVFFTKLIYASNYNQIDLD